MRYKNFEVQVGLDRDVDAVPAVVKLGHDVGFADLDEAVEHLRRTVIRCLSDREPLSCCASWRSHPNFMYCPECGFRLVDGFPSPDEARDYFLRILVEPVAVLKHAGVLEHFRRAGWRLTGFVGDDPPCLVRGFGRWIARQSPEDVPYVTGKYPDGKDWDSTFLG